MEYFWYKNDLCDIFSFSTYLHEFASKNYSIPPAVLYDNIDIVIWVAIEHKLCFLKSYSKIQSIIKVHIKFSKKLFITWCRIFGCIFNIWIYLTNISCYSSQNIWIVLNFLANFKLKPNTELTSNSHKSEKLKPTHKKTSSDFQRFPLTF